MLYLGISSYFFNTAGDVYYKAGALNFQVTDDMVRVEYLVAVNSHRFMWAIWVFLWLEGVLAEPWEVPIWAACAAVGDIGQGIDVNPLMQP